jgi:hypothetical protein
MPRAVYVRRMKVQLSNLTLIGSLQLWPQVGWVVDIGGMAFTPSGLVDLGAVFSEVTTAEHVVLHELGLHSEPGHPLPLGDDALVAAAMPVGRTAGDESGISR